MFLMMVLKRAIVAIVVFPTTASLAFTPSARPAVQPSRVTIGSAASLKNRQPHRVHPLKHWPDDVYHACRLLMSLSSSNENPRAEADYNKNRNATGESEKEEEEELTVAKIAELIDCSFVQACMQLAEGYVDVLKLMIASIQSAFNKGIPLTDLIQAIEDIQPGSAGRMLMPEETKLRNTWIQVVYIMLANLTKQNFPQLEADMDESYAQVAPILIRRKALSNDFHAKELFEAASQFFPNNLSSNPLEETIVLQTLRVMWVTMSVVEEAELCEGEFARMDAKLQPKPPIPGAFD